AEAIALRRGARNLVSLRGSGARPGGFASTSCPSRCHGDLEGGVPSEIADGNRKTVDRRSPCSADQWGLPCRRTPLPIPAPGGRRGSLAGVGCIHERPWLTRCPHPNS